MARVLRVPGVADLLISNDPAAIATLTADDRLDRNFASTGPLLNRVLAGRIRRVLVLEGKPLPPVSPRQATGRAEAREALASDITARTADAPCDAESLDRLATLVRQGADADVIGPAAQTAIGRLFVADFTGTPQSWAAARTLDAAVRSFNPLRRLRWLITGEVGRARATLAGAMRGNAAALHGVGIAVHNLVVSLQRMAALAAEPDAFRRISATAAAARSLAAPSQVLRQATRRGACAEGEFRPGTLVLLQLDAAHARSLRGDVAFLSDGWGGCPAARWVPALLAAVWARAATLTTEPGA